jgi:hypothetical protein
MVFYGLGENMIRSTLAAVVFVLVLLTDAAMTQELVLEPDSDSYVRTDADVRRNDNYGCDPNVIVGGSRGGGGIPLGGPDAMRLLLHFDLSTVTQPAMLAVLELTISDFHSSGAPQVFVLQAHRALDSWSEGSGNEQTIVNPDGCDDVNSAGGVAWVGAGDGGDANNQTQPTFDPTIFATDTVDMTTSSGTGEIRQWDVTALVNGWISGAYPNHGIVLRDPTSDGSAFKQIGFASREAEAVISDDPNWPSVQPGPRLKLFQPVSVEAQSWGRTKALYQNGN